MEEKIRSHLQFTRRLADMLYNVTDPPHSPVDLEKGNNFPKVPQLVSN